MPALRASPDTFPRYPLGVPSGWRRTAAGVYVPPSVLTVVGAAGFNNSGTGNAYSFTATPPAFADGALLLAVWRANGAPTYAPVINLDAVNATLLANNAAGVADFGVVLATALIRGLYFAGQGYTLTLDMGASGRTPGLDIIWLTGVRAATALGISSLARQTTSNATTTTAATPTTAGSLIVSQSALWAGSAPSLNTGSPASGPTVAYSGISGSTLGARYTRYEAAADNTTQLTRGATFTQAGTSRGTQIIELVR